MTSVDQSYSIFHKPLFYSTDGLPVQVGSSATTQETSHPLHLGKGFDDPARQTVREDVSLWITNRHASSAAKVFISVGGASTGLWIARTVPPEETVPLFSDGSPLSLLAAHELRVWVASGPLPQNVSVLGRVEQVVWSAHPRR